MILSKKRPIPLTLRVLLFVMLAIGFCLMISSFLIVSSIRHHFTEQDTDEIRAISQTIVTALQKTAATPERREQSLLAAIAGHHGAFFLIQSNDEKQLYRTSKRDFTQNTRHITAVDITGPWQVETWQSDGETYRGLVSRLTIGEENFRITVALDMSFHLQFLQTFKHSLWLIMLATGSLTLLAAWIGIYQGHLPLRSLSKRIRKIQTSDLHTRLNPNSVPIELHELVLSFNQMIEQLEKDFERLSHFSSDIAHELRTPLTNLITQTQVALGNPRPAEFYRELLYSSLEEQERLSKMVSDMLWLAKSDNALIRLDKTTLLLNEEVQALFDFFDALAAENQLILRLEGNSFAIEADRGLLRRALSNLLSNAIRHTPRGETITVRLTDNGNTVTLSVINPGSTIQPEHIPKLFDRFYRADPSRQRGNEGAGLGLAITKSIVLAHQGNLDVFSKNQLTEFKISLTREGK